METLTELERELIRLMADLDLNVTAVAKTTYRNRNTVVYHIEKIKKKTGLDPKRFHDCVKLLEIIGREETV